jgi:hypothetical protein
MVLRSFVYDIMSWLLTASSLFFFYQSTQFLVAKDYIAAGMTLFIGFLMVKMGLELGKLALVMRRRYREGHKA